MREPAFGLDMTSSESTSPDATGANDPAQLRRELAMERLRRQVYESVARQELLSHTLGCLTAMIERETPRLSACIVYADGSEAPACPNGVRSSTPADERAVLPPIHGVAGRGGAPMVADSVAAAHLKESEWPASVEACETLAVTPRWAEPYVLPGQTAVLWSLPLPGNDGGDAVLGTLMMLLDAGDPPSESERAVAGVAAELAGFAISCARNAELAVRKLMHDALTGLPNAMLLKDRLVQAMEVSRRQGTTTALLLVDINGLNTINESLGRGAGDDLLRKFADRLRGGTRRSDTVARLGGAKFAMVGTVNHGNRDVSALTSKIVSLLTSPTKVCGREVSVGVNVGVSLFPVDTEDAGELLQAAEVALHRAKGGGRNSIAYFKPQEGTDGLAAIEMETRFRRSVEFALMSQALGGDAQVDVAIGRLELYYQPQVDQSGKIIGAEALSRWTDPVLGRVPPDRFIAVAERNGLIIPFGRWALRQAASQARKWRDAFARRAPRVAVNVSAVQFADDRFIDDVASVINTYHLTPGMLELELTETVLMHDAAVAAQRISQLRQMGVAVAIDDFGTGYSSLAYLHQLTIDTLKVDRSFVAGMSGERRGPGSVASGPLQGSGAAVTRAIISMGRSLGMNVLAEGVETEAQQQLLIRMGCDHLQGYLFSPPVPAEKFAELMTQGGGTLPLPTAVARPA